MTTSVRVLKAHRDAAKAAMPQFVTLIKEGKIDDAMDAIALAVIGAHDYGPPHWVIAVKILGHPGAVLFGPYPTIAGAERVAQSGKLPIYGTGDYRILPLLAGPPRPARPTRATGTRATRGRTVQ